MATKKTEAAETLKQLTYLAAALKAPRITEAAGRLADHARDAGWTHEEYLAAVLDREVAARNASGAQLRIRAAGFGSRKTIEEFDWDAQPAVRQQVASLATECCSRPRPNGSPGSPTPTAPAGYLKNSPGCGATA
jgi:DNA replication protein DnaC